jgi:hypothetical protein
MQPVGELYDDHTHVAAHRHYHLPQGLGLRLLEVPRRQPLELGDPVDDVRDLLPEPCFKLLLGKVGVLKDIVKERRGDGRRVQAQVGEYVRRREGVVHERFPALADLTLMGSVGRPVGAGDQLLVGLLVVGGDLAYEGSYRDVRDLYGLRVRLFAENLHVEIIAVSYQPSAISFLAISLHLSAISFC